MRDLACKFLAVLLLCSTAHAVQGQSRTDTIAPSPLTSSDAQQMEQRLETMSAALSATRLQLEESAKQVQQLQEELAMMKKQLGGQSATTNDSSGSSSSVQTASSIDLRERVETLEAQVKLQDQTKVETESKYPIRFGGLVLLNGFVNRGAVDNLDLPSIAVRPVSYSGGSIGAGMRQTIINIEGFGPRIAGARTTADLSFDFYGGIPYSNYGTVAGIVRMRTAKIRFDWERNSLEGGMEQPLISPLSPTSYATIAEPGMAWAGNLWTWAPQLRFAHQFLMSEKKHLQLEAGLWDPPSAGYNSSEVFRGASSGERSNQPGYEARISYGSSADQHEFQIGLSGYYSRQVYPAVTANRSSSTNDSWAFATDWKVPFAHRFEVSGEGYRGRSLGGFGGGVYKDVLMGNDPVSGAAVTRGLNDIGGWAQLKTKFSSLLEANASAGLDNGFASDFHSVVLPAGASATQLRARNRMIVGNVIYRPKTYLVVSPEYRRIWTWPIYGSRNTADIFTLSLGYQF